MKKKNFPRNSFLCKQGDAGDEIYIVHKGDVQLQLSIEDKSTLTVKKDHNHPGKASNCPIMKEPGMFLLGRPKPAKMTKKKKITLELMNLRAPQILGEGAMLKEGGKRSASLLAVTDVETYILTRADFNKYVLGEHISGEESMYNRIMKMKNHRGVICGKQVMRSLMALNKVKNAYHEQLNNEKMEKRKPSRPSTSPGKTNRTLEKEEPIVTKKKRFNFDDPDPATSNPTSLRPKTSAPVKLRPITADTPALSRSGGGAIGYADPAAPLAGSFSSGPSLNTSVGWPFTVVSAQQIMYSL